MDEKQVEMLSHVSAQLSAASLGHGSWEQAMTSLTDTMGGVFSTFELIDKKSGQVFEFHGSSGPEINQQYIEHYMPLNPRIQYSMLPGASRIMFDHKFISDAEMDGNEFYADFLRPFGLRYFLGFTAFETDDVLGAFTLQRSKACGAVDTEELEIMSHLAPVMTIAAETYVNHGKLLAKSHHLEHALDRLNEGVVYLDLRGQVMDMNEAGQRILHHSDGLKVSQGQLVCAHPDDQRRLTRAFRALCDPQSLNTTAAPLAVRRPSGQAAYVVRLHRSEPPNVAGRLDQPGLVIAFVHDPVAEKERDIQLLCDAFGMTPAEASVAIAIETGLTPKEYAEQNAVSLTTVRTQIQRVMQKTHVNRQADVVRVLAAFWATSS